MFRVRGRRTTVGKQAGVSATKSGGRWVMWTTIWYARRRETDITEDSLRLTGPGAGRQPSRYHTDVSCPFERQL
ncbi:unnamed protein product [Lasius platythorax]|uniref:Uncharacterized protein n=1 Tax=Lasius platythorax TaxID=488582 RepID=A0AAV2NTQ4_9HYME